MSTTAGYVLTTLFSTNETVLYTGQFDGWENATESGTSGPKRSSYNALLTVTVPIIMFASGVLGNVLALAVLGTSRKKHRKTVFYRLVGALACTDLFGIISVSPITIVVYSKGRTWIGGEHLCNYSSFMMIFSGIATLLIVGAMALERFVAIIHPYAYETRFSTGKVKYIVLGIWVTSAVIAALPMIGLGENSVQYPGTWCFFNYTSDAITGKIFTYFYASVGLLVIAVTALCNVAVMIVLVKMRQAAKEIKPTAVLGRQPNKLDSEVQMMILLGGIILVFATCYAPLMVSMCN
ncbi:hypothetical protein SNE40_012586 [Patella caerulea]|uniref:Prostaglandin E2 receptor EP4 subtype n=1 Tax=Patella caerulea TaxID=87958 RepID=A0AAN8JQ71_PATCE